MSESNGQAVVLDPEAVLTPDGFAALQVQVLAQSDEAGIWPARSFAPSLIGHPCNRFIAWRFNRWRQQAAPPPWVVSMFGQGKAAQPVLYQRLEALGFEVERESRRPWQYEVGGHVIAGRPDGLLLAFRGVRYRPPVVLEAKTVNEYVWRTLRTAADVQRAPWWRVRSYYAQGQVYCFLANLPRGVFALLNKMNGLVKLISFELDFGYVEALLQRVEALAPLVRRKLDPPPISYSDDVCGTCGFRALCYPPKNFGEGAQVITDPLLLEDLGRAMELKAAAVEYDALWSSVTDRLKLLGIQYAVAGPFLIDGQQRRDGAVVYSVRRAGGVDDGSA